MAGVIVAVVIAFVVVGVVLARQTTSRKKEATKSLQAEMDAVGSYSIAEMVGEEVKDLGLRDIPGSEGISSETLLKVWNSSQGLRSKCEFSDLRFTITSGAPPTEADTDDVELTCEPSKDDVDDEPTPDDTNEG
ncbi:MAG: hypothetical protein ACR2N2_05630 [Acidimicrobiia bacterium]